MKDSTQLLVGVGSVLAGHYGGFEAWLTYMVVALVYVYLRTKEQEQS